MPAKKYFEKEVGFILFRENSPERQRGFTLIELLVVIAIISIMMVILFVSFTQVQKNARDAQRKSDLQTLASMLQRFYSDNSHYPSSISSAGTENGVMAVEPDCSVDTIASLVSKNLGFAFTCNSIIYSKQLPLDPFHQPSYCYHSISNNQGYEYYANMENSSNANLSPSGTCGSAVTNYNYRITAND